MLYFTLSNQLHCQAGYVPEEIQSQQLEGTMKRTLVAILIAIASSFCGQVAMSAQDTKQLAVSTVAGQPQTPGANDSPDAKFFTPVSVTSDKLGNVYLLDTYNHTIRKISPSGVVTTHAGIAGQPGANDSPNARFNHPEGMIAAADGTLFVTDLLNHTVRRVSPMGTVTTIAGTAGVAGSYNGIGLAAQFNGPQNLAIAGDGSLVIADTFNHQIRRISSTGVVTTVAGIPLVSGTADSPDALFNYPIGSQLTRMGTS